MVPLCSSKVLTAACFQWITRVGRWLEHIPAGTGRQTITHTISSHTYRGNSESNQANVRVLVGVIMFLDCGHRLTGTEPVGVASL